MVYYEAETLKVSAFLFAFLTGVVLLSGDQQETGGFTLVTTGCRVCKGQDVFLRKKGNATGLYCSCCGAWYKWLGKKEVLQYLHRGFKVYPEDYVPANPVPRSVSVASGVPVGVGVGGKFDVVDDNDGDVPLTSNTNTGYNVQTRNTPVESASNPCPTCLSGVLDPISTSDDIQASFFQDVFMIYNKDKSKIYGSFRIKYCPTCGKKL